jgi:hypothetical protein
MTSSSFMPNWINPAFKSLVVTRRLIDFRNQDDLDAFDRIISYWRKADESRDQPRELLRWFGEGLALFVNLPEYIKNFETSPGRSAYNVWVRNGLTEALAIAEANRIRVTFDTTGPIFH